MTSSCNKQIKYKDFPRPAYLSLIYLVIGGVWATLANSLLDTYFHHLPSYGAAELIEGWSFVLVSATALYWFSRSTVSKVVELRAQEMGAQTAKEELERLISQILDNSSDAIFAKDLDGRYLFFNREVARVTGVSPDQSLGQTDEDIFPIEQAQMIRRNDRRVMQLDQVISTEEILNTKYGVITYHAVKGPLHDRDGAVSGMFGISRDITERTLLERDTQDVKNRLLAILDALPDLLFEVDMEGYVHEFHSPRRDLLLKPPDQIIGHRLGEFGFGEAAHICMEAIREAHERGYSMGKEYWLTIAGKDLCFEASVSQKPTHSDTSPRFILLAREITQRKVDEEELRIASITFDSQEGVLITDSRGVIVRVNKAFTTITGYAAHEATGKTPAILHSGRNDKSFYEQMWRILLAEGYWQGELWNCRKNGEFYVEWLTISAVKNPDGVTTHYVGTFSDITRHKQADEEIHRLAFFDPLTNLPNRRLLHDRIQHAIAQSGRTNTYCALVFLDLDQFKNLNDTQGHVVGDQMLAEVAHRLRQSLREGDTAARFGGDEFMVLLEGLSEVAQDAVINASKACEHIRAALGHPYILENVEYYCTVSIGISLFRNHDESVESAIRHADIAMFAAKKAGRNTIRFFDPQMQAELDSHAVLENDLHTAIQEGQFELFYQPQMNYARQIVGVEALIRWNHPHRGVISPADFIPVAENSGLIVPLGEWVLTQACQQIAQWTTHPVLSKAAIAVNVSLRQFQQRDFIQQVQQTLERTNAPANRLKLEITETLVLGNTQDTVKKMRALKSLGITFSLDDFGTGSSSLAYLSQLPLNQLKIDKSFIQALPHSRNDALIAQTIIAMGDGLELEVIAEGVETLDQCEYLHEIGCLTYQGFLFSTPLAVVEVEHFASSTLL